MMPLVYFYIALSIVSAIFVYRDAARHKLGKRKGERGFWNISGPSWAIVTLFLWIPSFFVYLGKRWELMERARRYPCPVSPMSSYSFQVVLVCLLVLVAQRGYSSAVFGINIPKCHDTETTRLVERIFQDKLAGEPGKGIAFPPSVILTDVRTVLRDRETAELACQCRLSISKKDMEKNIDLFYSVGDPEKHNKKDGSLVYGQATDDEGQFRVTVFRMWPGKLHE